MIICWDLPGFIDYEQIETYALTNYLFIKPI
jgi:hypothetical protein